MIDLRQLQALRAVADHGSVLAAAQALGWSQPTVTHHLRGLERMTSVPVVSSSRTGTRLSEAGRLWLPHAMAILDRAERAALDVRAAVEEGRRRVRLGIFPTAAARLLPGLVAAITDLGYEPSILEGELHELTVQLDRLSLDAAVVFDRQGVTASVSSGLRRETIFTERLSLIVPRQHPLADGSVRRLADFEKDAWVFGTSDTDPGDAALLSAARAAGFVPVIGPRSDDYRVVAAYVTEGLGIALVPELALPQDGWNAGFAVVSIADYHFARDVALLTAPTLDPVLVESMSRTIVSLATVDG